MADRCAWAERVIMVADPADQEVLRHMEACSECRAERFAHDELVAAFRGTTRPALSPHFRSHLMARIAQERQRRALARRHLTILRLYWVFAAVVCCVVLANLGLSSAHALQQAPLLFAVGLFVLPICAVLIAIRFNPVELLLRTLMGTAGTRLPGPR